MPTYHLLGHVGEEPVRDKRSLREWAGLSQMFRSFEANSGTIERKGSEDLAKSSTFVVDQYYLGSVPEV
jgi:hypothetical protein